VRLGRLGRRRGLDGGRGRHGRAEQFLWQVGDALEVQGVEDLEGEDDLVELDLAVGALEDAGAASDGEVRLLVGQVRTLHGDVAVVAQVEAVDGLVPVAVALRHVLDQEADPGRHAQALVKAPVVHLQTAIQAVVSKSTPGRKKTEEGKTDLVSEGDQVAQRVLRLLGAEAEVGRALAVALVDLVHVHLLHLGRARVLGRGRLRREQRRPHGSSPPRPRTRDSRCLLRRRSNLGEARGTRGRLDGGDCGSQRGGVHG
jgi:hypothetical protein